MAEQFKPYTPGQIAKEVDVAVSQINYILATRPHIKPIGRAGIIRLYPPSAVEQVREALQKIAKRRRLVSAGA